MPVNIPESQTPRVVIIGGGYGGITLGKALAKAPVQVVMLDKNNYHCFQPLLYQVATGGLEPDSIAFPLRKLFEKQKNFYFRMASVESIDPEAKQVHTNLGYVNYDYLVVASGGSTNYFGNDMLEKHALGMKSIPEALNLRSLILQNLEKANHERDPQRKQALLNFVVVGGGPTGVEMAGALAELKRHILPADYPEMDFEQMQIYLLEGGDRLLVGMSEKSSNNAKIALEKLDVQVVFNTFVKNYDGHFVESSDDAYSMPAENVIWSAGIKGEIIPGLSTESVERGRLKVDAYSRVDGYDDIYAVGDVALMVTDPAYPKGHPQVAPAAIQQAEQLGINLPKIIQGKNPHPFNYYDKGAMATIGRNKAVVDWNNIHLKGLIAWLGWMFVHLLYLIGFRNKLVVFANWVWSYFTYDKGTRLIIRPFDKPEAEKQEQEEEPERELVAS
jgi:NADH dehydrogenase